MIVFAPHCLKSPTVCRAKFPKFSQGGLVAGLLCPCCEVDRARYEALRYAYFVAEKKWVEANPLCPERERDDYDPASFHLGVWEETTNSLLAYLRLLPWRGVGSFMLEADFAALLSVVETDVTFDPTMGEISRLVVMRSGSSSGNGELAVELLFKLLYRFSQALEIQWYYAVVETQWHAAFVRRFHFPFERLGRSHTFPDGTRTCCIRAHIPTIEQSLYEKVAPKLAWYRGN